MENKQVKERRKGREIVHCTSNKCKSIHGKKLYDKKRHANTYHEGITTSIVICNGAACYRCAMYVPANDPRNKSNQTKQKCPLCDEFIEVRRLGSHPDKCRPAASKRQRTEQQPMIEAQSSTGIEQSSALISTSVVRSDQEDGEEDESVSEFEEQEHNERLIPPYMQKINQHSARMAQNQIQLLDAQHRLHQVQLEGYMSSIDKQLQDHEVQIMNDGIMHLQELNPQVIAIAQAIQSVMSRPSPQAMSLDPFTKQITGIQEQRKYDDCASWHERFNQIACVSHNEEPQIEVTQEIENYASKVLPQIDTVMEALKFPLNNNQKGVTMFALYQIFKSQTKKIFIQAPPGKGKSRMVAGIMFGTLLRSHKVDKIVVVFSSKFLMDTDKPILDSLRYRLCDNAKTENCTLECVLGIEEGIKHCKGTNVLLVIDEGDYCILDVKSDLKKLHENQYRAIVAVSASLPVDDKYDAMVLKNDHGFFVYDTNIRGSLKVEMARPKTLQDFMQENQDRAKLVFTSEQRKESVSEADPTDMTKHFNLEDLEKMRKLTSQDLCIVTKEEGMRGYDYRCETGIDLFIDEPLSNERSFIQALGRVGRYTDQCARYHRLDMDPLFYKQERQLSQAQGQGHNNSQEEEKKE